MNETSTSINYKALAVSIAIILLFVGFVVILERGEGPSSRCEARGGHFLVGPAGEISCVSRENFVPLPDPPQG